MLTADPERRTPSPEPCAPGSPAPHTDLALKVRRGAGSSLLPSAAGPRTRWGWAALAPRVSSAPRSPGRLPAGTRDPRHPRFYLAALRTPISFLLSLPFPLGSSRNPAPRALGEEAEGLPPSPGVGRKHWHPLPPPLPSPVCNDFQVEISPLLSFQNIPVPAFCYHPNFGGRFTFAQGRYSVLSFVSTPNSKLRVFGN